MKERDFEGKIVRAKEILEGLMNPEVSLEEGVKLYKEGLEELKSAQEILNSAKIEYEEIKRNITKSDENI